MNQKQHDKVFFNRAKVTKTEQINCEKCFEDIIFALRDNYHEFSIGLSTILECLKHSEREGIIPPISDEWWIDVYNNYYKGDFL